MGKRKSIIPAERIKRAILAIRGQRVILYTHLAEIFGVSTMRLNEQVRRNISRFPDDFAFLLTREEVTILKSQFAISSSGWGGRRKLPFVFTEHGSVMAANVLNTPTAVAASIEVVRAFIRLREWIASHADLARKLDALEKKYDAQFKVVFDAIRQLMAPPSKPTRGRIGFHS